MSFAKAVQTGHWHGWDPPARGAPSFSFEQVDALLRELDELERGWAGWFEERRLEPMELSYEELVADHVRATLEVLDFLSLELPARVSIRPLTRAQEDAASDDWCSRYRAEALRGGRA